jgi:hypothetical protein
MASRATRVSFCASSIKRGRGRLVAVRSVTQTTRLIPWTIAGLIVLGIFLHFFGPAALEIDELIVIGLLILVLVVFQVWLYRSE